MYTIGISSGIWSVAKATGAAESQRFAGLSNKLHGSIVHGVNFVQLDLERLTEFLEPDLEEKIKKTKELGYTFGIHGECAAFGSEIPLDSSDEDDYKRAHDVVEQHIKKGSKIGAKYLLFHSSESIPFVLATRDLKHVRLVDMWGRPFADFLKGEPKLLDWAIENKFINELVLAHYNWSRLKKECIYNEIENIRKGERREPTSEEMKKIEKGAEEEVKEEKIKTLKDFTASGTTMYCPDRLAYTLIAKWMEMNKDSLWQNMVGNKKFEDVQDSYEKWVPAIAAKYYIGHFVPKGKYKSLKDLAEKHKIPIVFETPMPPQAGYELYMRLPRLVQIYYTVKQINSNFFGIAVDIEHLLDSNLDPKKEIEDLPMGSGKLIKVIHAGFPAPYPGAHLGIELGSEAQLYTYERLYELRKKGFESGWIIFERGSEEAIKTSILSLREIVKFLEKDIPPKELPEEFYGMPKGGPEIARQKLAIKEHALEPLKGMLVAPEEEHTFLSASAKEKEKWKKEEYK